MKHNDYCSIMKFNGTALDLAFPKKEEFPKIIGIGRYSVLCGFVDPYCDCSYCLGYRKPKKSWKYYRKHQWRA